MGAMPNKTDRNDARAIAQIMRTGWFKAVHVKTPTCRSWRSLLVARRAVLNEMRTIEYVVRAILCAFRRSRPGIRSEGGRLYRLKPAGDSDDPATPEARSRVDVVIRSVGRLGVKLVMLGGCFSEALALEREPVSVVHQPIENGIGESWITDDLVPMFDRELAGDHGRSAPVPILHDLQEVMLLFGGHGSKSPVVEDQKFDASQALEEPSVMTVAACQREGIEETRQALIKDRAIIPTSFVTEGAGN